jgi:hypothetical protein
LVVIKPLQIDLVGRRDSEEPLLSSSRTDLETPPIPNDSQKDDDDIPKISFFHALTPQIILNIAVYSGLSLHSIAFDELFPIFCATKIKDGGLGMSTDQIGLALSITGISSLIVNITIFPWAYNKLGGILCLRIASSLFILAYFVLSSPFLLT